MMRESVMLAAGAIALAALVALPCAAAREAGFRKNVGDYSIYLAVMPVEQATFYFTHPSFAAPRKGASERSTHESRP